ncbi:DUF169 domain-containing protein [Methanolobus halotolerans]|uniref:DUF169 domain-containing protein n=1 Tax=Methanolobus halotolerans TaxID=2052935 RepID=UPI001F2583FB|nr:DUF169 domain-containing protein [Methanolobus halotolerans]
MCITFENEKGTSSELLYCEIVHRARYGESFLIEKQRCSAGDHILGKTSRSPADYYLRAGRYRDMETAIRAADSLLCIEKEYRSIRIEPLSVSKNDPDVFLLFLRPESAMRILQAYAYHFGKGPDTTGIGAASICCDCTARPLTQGLGMSFGCKGSRKHSDYADTEVPLGISRDIIQKIEEGLEKTPDTYE